MLSAFPSFAQFPRKPFAIRPDALAHASVERKRGLLARLSAKLIEAREREAEEYIARLRERSVSKHLPPKPAASHSDNGAHAPTGRKRKLLQSLAASMIEARRREAEEYIRRRSAAPTQSGSAS